MTKARRMALVPEEDIFSTMVEEGKLNTSPLLKSLANMDQEIKIVLEDNTMPADRKIQLYDRIMNRYRAILNQYRAKIPYVRILPTPKQKKRKRTRRPAFATPIGSAVLLPPPSTDADEEEEPLLLPTPPTETPLQLPTPPEATPFKPPNQRKEKKGKRLLPSPKTEDPYKTSTEENRITTYDASSSLDNLLEQLYKFSASGAAIIFFVPDVNSERERERAK